MCVLVKLNKYFDCRLIGVNLNLTCIFCIPAQRSHSSLKSKTAAKREINTFYDNNPTKGRKVAVGRFLPVPGRLRQIRSKS